MSRACNWDLNKAIELYKQGKTVKEISSILKVNRTTLSSKLVSEGIIEGKKFTCSKRVLEIITRFKNGESIEKIKKDLKVGYRVVKKSLDLFQLDSSANSKKYHYKTDIFKHIDSEEKAYWLGFILADGNISTEYYKDSSNVKGSVLEITLAYKDVNHLEKFCHFIGAETSQISDKTTYLNNKKFKSKRISICCTEICNDLAKFDILANKTFNTEIPSQILKSKYLNSFIRGYFDGDGHVSSKANQLSFTSGSPKILVQLQLILDHLKVHTYLVPRLRSRTVCLWSTRVKDVHKILNYMYKDAIIFLDRKYSIYVARCGGNFATGGRKIGEDLIIKG